MGTKQYNHLHFHAYTNTKSDADSQTVAKAQELKEKSDLKETEEFRSIVGVLRVALIKLSKRLREKLGFKKIEKK